MTREQLIYLDSQASTRVDNRVLERMIPFFTEHYGNASGSHLEGRRLYSIIEEARFELSNAFGASPEEFFFTSGATESNNLVFWSVAGFLKSAGRDQVLISTLEHKSVIEPALALREKGFQVDWIPVDRDGLINFDKLNQLLGPQVGLVSIVAAHNEIGVVQNLEAIAELCRERDVLFHTDFAQGVGYVPLDLSSLGVAFATFSAHKCYGPKGVGALYVAGGAKDGLRGLILGGGQEGGFRSGTLNVPGIVGMAEAVRLQVIEGQARAEHVRLLSKAFLEVLNGAGVQYHLNGHLERRLPGNLNLWFEGVEAEQLILSLPGIAISNGSACNSRALSPSHALTAIGCDRERAFESVRISFSKDNTLDEVVRAAQQIAAKAKELAKKEVKAPRALAGNTGTTV